MSISKYLEEQYDLVLSVEEYGVWKGSKYYKEFAMAEPSWWGDTAQKEYVCQQFEYWLVDRALTHIGSFTELMDTTINTMEENLKFLGDIAMWADITKSNQAVEKAMRLKLGLMMLRQGAPKGMTINAKVHQW
jgi:hypothetical protein